MVRSSISVSASRKIVSAIEQQILSEIVAMRCHRKKERGRDRSPVQVQSLACRNGLWWASVTAVLPKSIESVEQLESLLSQPSEQTVRVMKLLEGDILVLGVGGKMGPTLARMAKRASDLASVARRVIGVARFSSANLERRLQSWGVETIRCDLLNRPELWRLPDAPNVIYMAGMKFGSTDQEWLTWAMNSYLPGMVAERFRNSRITAFSTGNVYGLCPVCEKGSGENSVLQPVGEYAMSCLGRERMLEHFSRTNGTKVSVLRLNYATEMRYGVLVDVAQTVFAGLPIPLAMGYLNAIWQGDANNFSLQSLAHASCPPFVINIAGAEVLSVRKVAEVFAERFQRSAQFEGTEAADALLSDARKAFGLFGKPTVSETQMIDWIAEWVSQGGETLAKPTHFENRAGRF
jgi:nucleoside-diphosphate-sugar epimerase